jgi:hypothetical protein
MSELGIAPPDVLCPPFNLPREPFEYRFKAPRISQRNTVGAG